MRVKSSLLAILAVGLSTNFSAHAQQQSASVSSPDLTSGTMSSDISDTVASFERKPISLKIGLEYQSNIDMLDPKAYSRKYADNQFINISGSTAFVKKMSLGELSYKPSLAAKLMNANTYNTTQDRIRNLEFKNAFYLKSAGSTESFSWGPTVDLSAQKRYTYPDFWRRKRDNAQAFIGLNMDAAPVAKLSVNGTAKVGYLDHFGNYTNPDSNHRKNEKNIQEDRVIYRASLTPVLALSSATSLSFPQSYERLDYARKKVRAGSDPTDRDMAKYTLENNLPYNDPTLDLQTAATGVEVAHTIGSVELSSGYTFSDIRELNDGQSRNDAKQQVISAGINYKLEKLSLGLSYSYDGIDYKNLIGGKAVENTNIIGTTIALEDAFMGVSATIDLKREHGSYWYNDGSVEKPNNDQASIMFAKSI